MIKEHWKLIAVASIVVLRYTINNAVYFKDLTIITVFAIKIYVEKNKK